MMISVVLDGYQTTGTRTNLLKFELAVSKVADRKGKGISGSMSNLPVLYRQTDTALYLIQKVGGNL
jgi:hypothetical protein